MKLQLLCLFTIVLLCSNPIFSQQIKGQIIDATTKEPIAFATVQFAEDNGVVSNMEGFFSLSSDNLTQETSLTISFMGYQTQHISVATLQAQNSIIKLKEAVNQLNTVYITNRLPNIDSIMARVHRNLKQNYPLSNVKQTLFARSSSYFKANNLAVEIDKSSGFNKKQLETSNQEFKKLTNYLVNTPPTQTFTDVLFEMYVKNDKEYKMNVKKATSLTDYKNNISLEGIQKKVTTIVLQHLDTSKTYKVKTGWFKIEDSLSFKQSKAVKKDSMDRKFHGLKSNSMNHITEHLFGEKSVLDFVLDTNGYDYEIANVANIDEKLVYIINFKPKKSRAKFKGTMYVSDEDYAILKLDYSYAEGKVGEKLNLKLLLGVKYVENVKKGTVIYKMNEATNAYFPFYINQRSGNYVYAHRPFKFIENSEDSKNKVAFDLTIEGSMVETYELMSLDYMMMEPTAYDDYTESKTMDYIQLKQYDPAIWEDYTVMEPLEELKKFKVEE